MSTETQKVDVVGVLGAMAVVADEMKWPAWVDRSIWERTQSAVAKLIAAATEVRAAHRELPGRDHPAEVRQEGEDRIGRAHYALEAALARVGGAV